MLSNFADVQQAIGSGDNLDKRAEISQPRHFAEVRLPDFGVAVRSRMICERLVGGSFIVRSNVDLARIFHVNLHAGLLDDAADHLSARSNHVANLVHRNLQGVDTWRERGNFSRGPDKPSLILSRMYSRPRCACAIASRMICAVMPPTLMSICSAVMPSLRSGDFEVHVAVVVFCAGNVGQDGVLISFLHQTHGHARHWCLSGTPASINESEAPQTEAIEEEPLDSRMSETTRMA